MGIKEAGMGDTDMEGMEGTGTEGMGIEDIVKEVFNYLYQSSINFIYNNNLIMIILRRIWLWRT